MDRGKTGFGWLSSAASLEICCLPWNLWSLTRVGGLRDDSQALFFFHLRVLSFKVLEVCVSVCVLHGTVVYLVEVR